MNELLRYAVRILSALFLLLVAVVAWHALGELAWPLLILAVLFLAASVFWVGGGRR